MTVFEFKIFFEFDEPAQCRYVVAKDGDEARAKIEAHYEKLSNEGGMKPCFISDPFVEIEGVII